MENEKPLVSVIVPMYNTEKYVAECLESVLSQTLKDFEMIVVNDCSTDKSVEIVESYMPKFDGRLKLLHTEANSGSPALPRNLGLEAASGKYVFFMDSDDVMTADALENLYDTVEKTEADVLICKRYLTSNGEGERFLQDIVLKGDKDDNNVELFISSIELRYKHWITNAEPHLSISPWVKLIKRDLLIENNIKFLPIMQEDSIWSFEINMTAKKIVLVPYICYIYRQTQQSAVSTKLYNPELSPESIYHKFSRIIRGLKHVDNFMNGIEFFKQNPQFRYSALEFMLSQNIQLIYANYRNYPPFMIYEKFQEAFKDETGDFDVLIAMLVCHSIHMIDELKNKKF